MMNTMWTWKMVPALIVVTIIVSVAQAIPPSSKPVAYEGVTADLDGDGVDERLIFICYDTGLLFGYESSGFDRFVLDIPGIGAENGVGDNLDGVVMVVDIDTTDPFKEIAIPESGPSSDDATRFFYCTGDSIVSIGTIPGKSIEYNGTGEVSTMRRERILHTWFYPARYRLNDAHQLTFVEEEYYPMGIDVTVLSELPLRVSPTDPNTSVVLQPGQTVTIMGGDDRKWCLVETKDGTRGWFEVEGYSFIVGANKRAGEVFDGLKYAD